jgi:hypothetical protein
MQQKVINVIKAISINSLQVDKDVSFGKIYQPLDDR